MYRAYVDFETVQSPIIDNIFFKLSQTNSNLCNNIKKDAFNTKYFTQNIAAPIVDKIKDFSILNVNIRSMQKNFGSLKSLINSITTKFDIISLTETWEDPRLPLNKNSNFLLPSYNLVSQPRTDKKGGGTAIFINNTLTYNIKKTSCVTKDTECLNIEIENKKGKNIHFSCIYRPPDGSITLFTKSIIKILNSALKNDRFIFIAGDMNIDLLNYNRFNNTHKFFDELIQKNIFPSIHKPTRVTRNHFSIIDNIFTNTITNRKFEAGIFKTDISDHFPTFLLIRDLPKENMNAKETIFRRDLTKRNLDILKEQCKNTNWENIINSSDTNDAFNNFSDKIAELFEETCPFKEKRVKIKELINPWMTNGLKKSSKRKQNLYNKFLKSRSIVDEINYKNYKYMFQKLLNKSKSLYYSNKLVKHGNDCRKSWQIINEVIGNSKNTQDTFPKVVEMDGVKITNRIEICDTFNQYYADVGPKLASKIPNVSNNYKHFLGSPCTSEMLDKALTKGEFNSAINSLKRNKASGSDELPSNVIIHILEGIESPLYHIAKLSISEGIFPEKLKISKIIPIPKKGDLSKVENYRPITLIPISLKYLKG